MHKHKKATKYQTYGGGAERIHDGMMSYSTRKRAAHILTRIDYLTVDSTTDTQLARLLRDESMVIRTRMRVDATDKAVLAALDEAERVARLWGFSLVARGKP